MREKDKNLEYERSQALTRDLEVTTEEISLLSLKSKESENGLQTEDLIKSKLIDEVDIRKKVEPCLEEEIVNDLNNNVDKSVIDWGNRAKLRRKNSSVSKNKRRQIVSEPVIPVTPRPSNAVARSLSLNRQYTYVGRTDTFWEDGLKNTDLCSTEL
ncbi:predicted protein [Nematostella vectensis]|uniref:Uncharacterized protein n=1 Tax=Nematostella vectensis TaxID=45351 RepID=A7RSY0_NEMVE|nr:predicted protein [Nematostella vectensis]|eukprot:XP_001637363.1 predicted protein [Nematostella vectensis]